MSDDTGVDSKRWGLGKKIAVGAGSLVVLWLIGSLVFVWRIGAWGIIFPSDHFDTDPPEIAADFGQDASLRFLVFSKTNSFRHNAGIDSARELFDQIAAKRDWAVFHSENSAIFDAEYLARFDVVVFSSASGNFASDEQDTAFRRWLEAGGGWVGIHAAGDDSHAAWTWYEETLKSGTYLGHILGPQFQEARVVVEDPDHFVTRGLPSEFQHVEEWYSWDRGAREAGFHVLLTVDESSYEPFIRGFGAEKDIRMGDHPIVWTRCVERGRALYSAMGHRAEAFRDSTYAQLLENAIEWTGGKASPVAPCNPK